MSSVYLPGTASLVEEIDSNTNLNLTFSAFIDVKEYKCIRLKPNSTDPTECIRLVIFCQSNTPY